MNVKCIKRLNNKEGYALAWNGKEYILEKCKGGYTFYGANLEDCFISTNRAKTYFDLSKKDTHDFKRLEACTDWCNKCGTIRSVSRWPSQIPADRKTKWEERYKYKHPRNSTPCTFGGVPNNLKTLEG